MANITTTTLDTWLPLLWSKMIQDALHTSLEIYPTFDRSLEAEVGALGDSIQVPHFAEIASTTSTGQPATISFTANTEGSHTLTLDQFTYTAVLINSVPQVQSVPGLLSKHTSEIGRSVADGIDVLLAADFDNFSTEVGTDNVAVGEQIIRDAIENLDEADVPSDNRFAVFSPATMMDIFGIERFLNSLNASVVANSLKMNRGMGWKGDAMNLAFIQSNNLKAGVAGKINAIYHRDAVQVAIQRKVMVERRQPHDQFADALRAWTLWGHTEARDTSGVQTNGR